MKQKNILGIYFPKVVMGYQRDKSLCIRIIFKIWMNLEKLKVPHLPFDLKPCCVFYV
jgi:hypothetical protein